MRGPRQIAEAHEAPGAAADLRPALPELDVAGVRLQQPGGDRADFLAERARREHRGAAADRHAAARPGASAVRHDGGVSREHGDLVERHVEIVGDDLGERGVGALPLVGDTDQRGDGAARLEAHRGSLLARDRRAAHAVELRAWAGELDEAGKADAEIAALRARRRLLASQAVVRPGLQQPRQRRLIAAAVVDVPRRRGVRELLGTHEIAAAHLAGVELEVARDQVDHALRHRGGDRVADRAVLRGDDLVLRDHAEGRVVVPQTVGPGQETEHLATFHDARARIGGVRPHRRGDRRPHRGEDAVAVGRDLDADRLLARVDVGQKRLASRGDELDGSAEHERHRARGHVVLVDVDLDAEAPAHVGRDHPHALLGQTEEVGEHRLHHVRDLRGDPERERAGGGLVVGDEPPRLDRHAGVPARREGARPRAMRRREGDVGVAGG